MALDSFTGFIEIAANANVSDTLTGFTNAIRFNNTKRKRQSFDVGTGAEQCQELYAAIVSLAGAANTSIDLSAFTDALGRTSQAMTKLKGVYIHLLSTADDADNGTAASSVTIGNGTNPQKMFMDADADTFTLLNGEGIAWFTPAAAGKTIDGTHKTIKILNNDASVTAKVMVLLYGS
jgi:hypothetical protein